MELKIGQSFEVVEVLDNWGFPRFKGLHCIISKSMFVKRTKGDFDNNPNNGWYLFKGEVKPIGKLTITKLK